MRPLTAVTVAIFLLVLLGLALVDGGAVLLALPFVLYLLLSLLAVPGAADLHISRSLSHTRLHADAKLVVTLTVHNHGPALGELLLADALPANLTLTDGSNQHLLALPAGASHSFSYTVQVPRGQYQFTQVTAVVREPFDLRRREFSYEVPGSLFAYLVPRAR